MLQQVEIVDDTASNSGLVKDRIRLTTHCRGKLTRTFEDDNAPQRNGKFSIQGPYLMTSTLSAVKRPA